jgi:hypothetical protein
MVLCILSTDRQCVYSKEELRRIEFASTPQNQTFANVARYTDPQNQESRMTADSRPKQTLRRIQMRRELTVNFDGGSAALYNSEMVTIRAQAATIRRFIAEELSPFRGMRHMAAYAPEGLAFSDRVTRAP